MVGQPSWLVTLLRQLPEGGAQAPAEVLSPVTALEEVIAVTSAIISGRSAPYPDDRRSLRADVLASLKSLGPVAQAASATAVNDFRQQALKIDSLLDDLAGAHALRADARVLLDELASKKGRIAALADCIDAFRGDASASICEERIRYLRTVVETSGHDWSERERHLSGALGDRYETLAAFSALDPIQDAVVYLGEAGLDLEERLELSNVILTSDPPRGDVAVWLAYANAFISGIYLQKGPIEFYDSRIWPAVIANNWPGNPNWTQPVELSDPAVDLFLSDLPDSDFVLVRVSLTDVPIAEARQRGRDLARAALELSGWDTEWVLMHGECAYANSWFGTFGFEDPRERALRLSFPLTDPAADVLVDLDEGVLDQLAAGAPVAQELLADIRWRRAVAVLPDAEHRISLLVALFERILVPSSAASSKWYGACERYFEWLFAFDDVRRQIWDAGVYGVHALPEDAALRSLRSTIIEDTGRNSSRVHHREVVRLAAQLLSHVDAASMEGRMLAALVDHTRDGQAAAAWLESSQLRFKTLLARTRRQRNAITHGTRVVPAVLETIEPFLNGLAGRLVGALHYSVAEGTDLTTDLQSWRLQRLKRRDALKAGGSLNLLVD